MRLDTVTLVLDGEVSLRRFAEAIARFTAFVRALSAEAGQEDLEWIIDDLSLGSTSATAKGRGDLQIVDRVVHLYGEVGVSLAEEEPIQYSPRVKRAAGRLRSMVGDGVPSMRLETAEREAIIRPRHTRPAPELFPDAPLQEVPPGLLPSVVAQPTLVLHPISTIRPAPSAFGAVQGRVQTLTNRGGLRFTLYDGLYDKAVSCYLTEGREDIMRDAWGKLATVEGWVTRDPITGRPLTVRQIQNVIVHIEAPGRWREARGVVPLAPKAELPEQVIRRLRDA